MPAGVFEFRIIKSKFLSPAQVRIRILNALIAEGKAIKGELEKTTATWVDHHPRFDAQVRFAKGFVFVAVTTDEKIWGYLNRGTGIRWALMSSGWVSKTTPGVISSGAGAGFVEVKGQGAMTKLGIPPRPGIEARRWTIVVRKDRQP